MMNGTVVSRHALLPVAFRFPDRPDFAIEFVIDTGYTGFLTLPEAAVTALQLPFEFDTPANLADDSEIFLPVHTATILWHGEEQEVRVLAMGKRPLLGTALLDGSGLFAQFTEQGVVSIDVL